MSGVLLQVPSFSLLLYTDTLMTRLGAHLLDLTAAGVWSWEEKNLDINVLEIKAIQLAFNAFPNSWRKNR